MPAHALPPAHGEAPEPSERPHARCSGPMSNRAYHVYPRLPAPPLRQAQSPRCMPVGAAQLFDGQWARRTGVAGSREA